MSNCKLNVFAQIYPTRSHILMNSRNIFSNIQYNISHLQYFWPKFDSIKVYWALPGQWPLFVTHWVLHWVPSRIFHTQWPLLGVDPPPPPTHHPINLKVSNLSPKLPLEIQLDTPYAHMCMHAHVCVCVCMHACVRACVCVCERGSSQRVPQPAGM